MNRRIFLLSFTMLAVASMEGLVLPRIQVDNEPDARIEIVPIDDAHRPAIPQLLADNSPKLPPGAFILVNHTAKPVTAVVVRWTYTDAKGEFRQSNINCDAYIFAPLDPIVDANDLALITPYGCTRQSLFSRLATGQFIGSLSNPTFGSAISVTPESVMHLYVDCVIFEDGQIWGPDKLHYYTEIQDRYSAVTSFLAEVTAGRSAGQDLPTVLARIRKDAQGSRGVPSTRASSRRDYYAGLLQRSPNPEGTLQHLFAQTPPPTFRHIGEPQ